MIALLVNWVIALLENWVIALLENREIARRLRGDVAFARAESRCLGPISTGRHVTPAPATVPCRVEEDSRTPAIGAAPDAKQLPADQRFGGRFDHRDHEAGECVSHRHEALAERAVVAKLHATVSGTAAQDAVDLDERVGARLFDDRAPLRERPQGGTHSASVHEGGRCPGRLLLGATRDADGPFRIEHSGGAQPLYECVEVPEHIDPHAPPQVIGVHEIQPQTLTDEYEGRPDHRGYYTGGGLRGDEGHWRQAYVASPARASEFLSAVNATRVTNEGRYIPMR